MWGTNKSLAQKELFEQLGKKAELRREVHWQAARHLYCQATMEREDFGLRGGLAIAGRPQSLRENLNATQHLEAQRSGARGCQERRPFAFVTEGTESQE